MGVSMKIPIVEKTCDDCKFCLQLKGYWKCTDSGVNFNAIKAAQSTTCYAFEAKEDK